MPGPELFYHFFVFVGSARRDEGLGTLLNVLTQWQVHRVRPLIYDRLILASLFRMDRIERGALGARLQ